jgi:hypothetical protein
VSRARPSHRSNSERSKRRRLDGLLWAAVIATALLLPLAMVMLSNATSVESSGAAPSADESSAVLGGVQRLLHAAVSLRVEPALAVELPAPPFLAVAAARALAALPFDSGPAVCLAASERRLL